MSAQDVKELETALRVVLSEVLEEKFGERFEQLQKATDKLHDTIYGNGKEGLVSVVNRHERLLVGASNLVLAIVTPLLIALIIGIIVIVVRFNQLGEPIARLLGA